MDLSAAPMDERTRSWNAAMTASPGDLDLSVPATDIVGSVPDALKGGRLLSNGPGWTLIGERLAHPFDGHGYVRSFRFEPDGSVRARARFVQTPAFVAEQREKRIVFRGLGTNRSDRFWRNVRVGEPRNVANTTIYRWASRLLAGWEAGAPYALDPESLETLGPETFGGAIEGQATLAHMHRDDKRGRMIVCNAKQGRRTEVTFRELDRSAKEVSTRTGVLPSMAFAHDFAFTDSCYVLAANPLALKPLEIARSLLGAGTMLRSVRARAEAPGELVLIPRDRQGPSRRVRLPRSAFVVHFANAFEVDGDLVVDACLFHDFPFGEEFGYAGPHAPLDPSLPEARGAQTLYRITIPAGSDEATWRELVPHGVDFPRIHPADEGQDTPVLFGACRADTRYSDPFDSLIRIDLRSPDAAPTLWTAPGNVFVGEPVVVPGPSGRAANVVAILSDGVNRRSTVVVFDAEDLARGPLAEVPLPLMPVAFHGDWDGTSS